MLLGETEQDLRSIIGSPDRRDYAAPESLYYELPEFEGSFLLNGGIIILIQFNVPKKISESLRWFTALGLHAADLENMTREEQQKKILLHYGNPPHVILLKELNIYSRGIKFQFQGDRISFISIFYPRKTFQVY